MTGLAGSALSPHASSHHINRSAEPMLLALCLNACEAFAAQSCVEMQAYVPYNTPYALPIPAARIPSFVGWAPNVSYPDVINSALFSFAGGASQYFGLRFTGVQRRETAKVVCATSASTQHVDVCDPQVLVQVQLAVQNYGANHPRLSNASRSPEHSEAQASWCSQPALTCSRHDRAAAAYCAGYLSIPGSAPAIYTFAIDNDDGAVLFIDGQSLVNHTGVLDVCFHGQSRYPHACQWQPEHEGMLCPHRVLPCSKQSLMLVSCTTCLDGVPCHQHAMCTALFNC